MLKKELAVKVKNQNAEIGKLATSCKEQGKHIASLEKRLETATSNARAIAQVAQKTTDEHEKLHHNLHQLIRLFSARRDTLTRIGQEKTHLLHAAYEARGIAQVLCHLTYTEVDGENPYMQEKDEQCAVCAAPVLVWWLESQRERAWYASCACAQGTAASESEARARRIDHARQKLDAVVRDDDKVEALIWKQQAEAFAKTNKQLQEVLAQNKHEVAFVQAAIDGAVPDDFMKDAEPWERLTQHAKQQEEELSALLDLEYYVPGDFAVGEDPAFRLNNYLVHLRYQQRKPVGLIIPITLDVEVKHG